MIDPADLTETETELVSCAKNGELCHFGEDDPGNGKNWGEERTVRAALIYALCTLDREPWLVNAKGVRLKGTRIDGQLDFEDVELHCPLHLISCYLSKSLRLDRARLPSLVLSGTYIELEGSNENGKAISAPWLRCAGSVKLNDGFCAHHEVDLHGAVIGGDLNCSGGRFESPTKQDALAANGVKCSGDILLDMGFQARGQVSLFGATVGGDVNANNGTFENAGGTALLADYLDCNGSVLLSQWSESDTRWKSFRAEGTVRLVASSVRGYLECTEGIFNAGGPKSSSAIQASGVDCKRGVILRNVAATGEVNFSNAIIGADLVCSNARFDNPDHSKNRDCDKQNNFEMIVALDCEALQCRAAVLLDDVKVKGAVSFLDAVVDTQIDATGAIFDNSSGCPDGHGRGPFSLLAEGLECKGSVFLERVSAKGEVRLRSAVVGGSLICSESAFEHIGDQRIAVDMQYARITGELGWDRLEKKPQGQVLLTGAHAGLLNDTRGSAEVWPKEGQLYLDGFVYDQLQPIDMKIDLRLAWLGKMPCEVPTSPKESFIATQPYEQLASIYHRTGEESKAKKVLIAKQRAKIEKGVGPWHERLWLRLLGCLVGYGYQPWRAVVGLVGFWLLGWGVFHLAQQGGFMAQQKDKLSDFSAAIYSLDTLVPVVDLHMEKYWEPTLSSPQSSTIVLAAAWWYLRLHIALGWILTSFAVLAMTGIVRQE